MKLALSSVAAWFAAISGFLKASGDLKEPLALPLTTSRETLLLNVAVVAMLNSRAVQTPLATVSSTLSHTLLRGQFEETKPFVGGKALDQVAPLSTALILIEVDVATPLTVWPCFPRPI
jgi:hypothetical protein